MLHDLGLVFYVIYLTAIASTKLAGNIWCYFHCVALVTITAWRGLQSLSWLGHSYLPIAFPFFTLTVTELTLI